LSTRNAYRTRTVRHAITDLVNRDIDRIREVTKAVLVLVNQALVDFFTFFVLELDVQNDELTDKAFLETAIGRLSKETTRG
jgi:hypothetical protein